MVISHFTHGHRWSSSIVRPGQNQYAVALLKKPSGKRSVCIIHYQKNSFYKNEINESHSKIE